MLARLVLRLNGLLLLGHYLDAAVKNWVKQADFSIRNAMDDTNEYDYLETSEISEIDKIKEMTEKLFECIFKQDIKGVEAAIAGGALIDESCPVKLIYKKDLPLRIYDGNEDGIAFGESQPSYSSHYPLHIATFLKNPKIVALLIGNRADVDVFDIDCKSPLHYAADPYYYSSDIVALLIAAGAKTDKPDGNDKCPIDYLKEAAEKELDKADIFLQRIDEMEKPILKDSLALVRRLLEIADRDTPEGGCVAAFLLELCGADVSDPFRIRRWKDCEEGAIKDMIELLYMFIYNGFTLPDLRMDAEFAALKRRCLS